MTFEWSAQNLFDENQVYKRTKTSPLVSLFLTQNSLESPQKSAWTHNPFDTIKFKAKMIKISVLNRIL